MLGCELTLLDEWTKSLLTNEPLLALLKADRHGRQIMRTDACAVWMNESDNGGAVCVALFNLKDTEETLSVRLDDCMDDVDMGREYGFRELWDGTCLQTVHQTVRTVVPAHGVKVFMCQSSGI